MRDFLSFALLIALVAPAAVGLLIMLKNELDIKQNVSGGYGILVIAGFFIVFVIMPVFAYFVRF